jgi:phosphoadenosine phosphosulfate reductase
VTLPDGPAQAAAWSAELEGRDPSEIIAWAIRQFGDRVVIGSSFGKDGLVVLDMARKLRPDIPVLFLETGYHFPETLQFRDQIRAEWGANIVDVKPPLTVEQQDAQYGAQLYASDPDRCCAMRKVAPLQEALAGKSAWMTGVRRSQHRGREATPVVEWQDLDHGSVGVYKVNPLVAWSLDRIDAYMDEHAVPHHPLWAKGYKSVGCAPCTLPVRPGEDERAGRWRGTGKTECGIHVAGVRRMSAAGADADAGARP